MLDAVFNACLADQTPAGPRHNPTGATYPPLPEAVAAAEKDAGPIMPAPPQPQAPTPSSGDEQHKIKLGEV